MLAQTVRQLNLGTRVKQEAYALTVVNREAINSKEGIVKVKTNELQFKMPRGHIKLIMFNIVLLGHYKVILGMPQITMYNPTINQEKCKITLEQCIYNYIAKQ